jgi:regulatory protein
MDAAFRMLSRRARSEAEIATGLAEHGASRTLVGRVLGRLRALGYIDDEKLAREWTDRWKDRGFGTLRIQVELRRIGVDETIVERVSVDVREERARARELLARRFSAEDLSDRRVMARAARFLAGRGFPPEVIDSLFEVWD